MDILKNIEKEINQIILDQSDYIVSSNVNFTPYTKNFGMVSGEAAGEIIELYEDVTFPGGKNHSLEATFIVSINEVDFSELEENLMLAYIEVKLKNYKFLDEDAQTHYDEEDKFKDHIMYNLSHVSNLDGQTITKPLVFN